MLTPAAEGGFRDVIRRVQAGEAGPSAKDASVAIQTDRGDLVLAVGSGTQRTVLPIHPYAKPYEWTEGAWRLGGGYSTERSRYFALAPRQDQGGLEPVLRLLDRVSADDPFVPESSSQPRPPLAAVWEFPWQAPLLVLVCLLAGTAAGAPLVRCMGRRLGGFSMATAAISVPLFVALAVDARTAFLGVWDVICASLLFSAGFLFVTHSNIAPDRREIALAVTSGSFGLLLLEAVARLFLPPPPAFPAAGTVHLRLSDAIAASAVSMWEGGGKVTTCDAIYGPGAGGGHPWPGQFPRTWNPRPEARKRVLHLGDSMVAGSGVDGQFTADLNRMEPEIEHINSGIGATAPDSYLALLWTWLSLHPPDLVVMHLTSNDLQELDQPYPCADWQPLLTYDGETRLRFAQAHLSNINRQRLRWLIHNSPPPYLLRLAVGFSHTAALAAAAFVRLGHRLGYSLPETDEDSHRPQLAAILRAARDELHRRGIPFVVNILPWRPRLEAHAPADETWVETKMKRIALSLGVDVLDASPEFEAATGRGEQLFTNAGGPLDIHFNAAGHALMASFLHQQLRR